MNAGRPPIVPVSAPGNRETILAKSQLCGHDINYEALVEVAVENDHVADPQKVLGQGAPEHLVVG